MSRSLHIYDCAGVAASLSYYQMYSDNFSMSLQMKDADIYNYADVYKTQYLVDSPNIYELVELIKPVEDNYDIIHVHFFNMLLPIIKDKYPDKKIVIHYHGSDVRGSDQINRIGIEKDCADGIIVATKDLLSYDYALEPTYLPTPIDDNFFSIFKPKSDKLFTVLRPQHSMKKAQEKIEELNLGDVRIFQRQYEYFPHKDIASQLYTQYGGYVQLIWDEIANDWIHDFSKTSLECLACGLSVIKSNGELHTELPEEHKIENVVKELNKFYDRL